MKISERDGPIPNCPRTRNASALFAFANRAACSVSSYSGRTKTCELSNLHILGRVSGSFTTGWVLAPEISPSPLAAIVDVGLLLCHQPLLPPQGC